MTIGFGGIDGTTGTHARAAHLALVQGGAQTADAARSAAASRIGQARSAAGAPTLHSVGTTYGGRDATNAARSAHEARVRIAAAQHDDFDAALLPMVLASGVKRAAADEIVAAIRSNPVLTAQAERAFRQARSSTDQ